MTRGYKVEEGKTRIGGTGITPQDKAMNLERALQIIADDATEYPILARTGRFALVAIDTIHVEGEEPPPLRTLRRKEG